MKITMDTHQAFNLLLQKGFTKEQAEGLIEVVSKVHEEVATKQDLREQKKELIITLGSITCIATMIILGFLPLLIGK
ncbi:MAG: hypothetical protein RL208_219 [Pseudomonadota bacterium]|jgi:hypothetical protein